jgi:putative flippase GtrA
LKALLAQFRRFFGVGIAAAIVHYGLLVALVEVLLWHNIPATLVGYVGGGLVSYVLNRRFTYQSERSHREAGWRFGVVAFVGFCLTGALMFVFNSWLGMPYLLAQVLITAIVLAWSFVAHKIWTFG